MTSEKNNALVTEMTIKDEWCKGCGICIAFCRKEALFLNTKGKAEKDVIKCINCGVCEAFCPDFAIVLIRRGTITDAGNKTGFDARQ